MRVTTQALLQVVAQNQRRMVQFEEEIDLVKQRQAENDERFNVLLQEVRMKSLDTSTLITASLLSL